MPFVILFLASSIDLASPSCFVHLLYNLRSKSRVTWRLCRPLQRRRTTVPVAFVCVNNSANALFDQPPRQDITVVLSFVQHGGSKEMPHLMNSHLKYNNSEWRPAKLLWYTYPPWLQQGEGEGAGLWQAVLLFIRQLEISTNNYGLPASRFTFYSTIRDINK